jgi:hypothetical protein
LVNFHSSDDEKLEKFPEEAAEQARRAVMSAKSGELVQDRNELEQSLKSAEDTISRLEAKLDAQTKARKQAEEREAEVRSQGNAPPGAKTNTEASLAWNVQYLLERNPLNPEALRNAINEQVDYHKRRTAFFTNLAHTFRDERDEAEQHLCLIEARSSDELQSADAKDPMRAATASVCAAVEEATRKLQGLEELIPVSMEPETPETQSEVSDYGKANRLQQTGNFLGINKLIDNFSDAVQAIVKRASSTIRTIGEPTVSHLKETPLEKDGELSEAKQATARTKTVRFQDEPIEVVTEKEADEEEIWELNDTIKRSANARDRLEKDLKAQLSSEESKARNFEKELEKQTALSLKERNASTTVLKDLQNRFEQLEKQDGRPSTEESNSTSKYLQEYLEAQCASNESIIDFGQRQRDQTISQLKEDQATLKQNLTEAEKLARACAEEDHKGRIARLEEQIRTNKMQLIPQPLPQSQNVNDQDPNDAEIARQLRAAQDQLAAQVPSYTELQNRLRDAENREAYLSQSVGEEGMKGLRRDVEDGKASVKGLEERVKELEMKVKELETKFEDRMFPFSPLA